jgi:hypothetical protein
VAIQTPEADASAVVFGGLRDAMAVLTTEFIARGCGEDATDLAACAAFVESTV